MPQKLTPLMQQYWDVKNEHPDKVILFRMGDFFEMFHSDAEIAAPILGIALTQRNKKDSDSAKMCGVPHHSVAQPIGKLLAAGLKVAICDQIEDPALAKGLVKRAVTRVLTPGMVYDPDTLDQLSAHYLSAYDETGVGFLDATTGSALYYATSTENEREELFRILRPVELILTGAQKVARLKSDSLYRAVLSEFDFHEMGVTPPGRLLAYVEKMQGSPSGLSESHFEKRNRGATLKMSATTIDHLEIVETLRGERDGSLFSAVNRTRTSAGARLLKSWLLSPLVDRAEILKRQGAVAAWLKAPDKLKNFRELLGQLGDVERRIGKVHTSTFNARDLAALAASLEAGEKLFQLNFGTSEGWSECADLGRRIRGLLNEELPLTVKEGGLIRSGAIPELDELKSLSEDMEKLLSDLELREKEATGIASLKVRYNSVFGFYIEITKTHAHKAPARYLRKQTLTNAERFTTDELSVLEEKVLSARSRRDQMEFEIFSDLRAEVIRLAPHLLQAARIWSRWDAESALAWLALERKYVAPLFNDTGVVKIELARHPILEQNLRDRFVPNSVNLEKGEALLLTGPNMAGKSTLMRQVALIAVLAQVGSFVPATAAELPLFDQIFTRIGASDALHEGLSTFMVEMSECAEILKKTTAQSLVIVDEVGRGTSTYDGLSLAQAILEYLVGEKRPTLFFATHYHELTALAGTWPQIRNAHMGIQEKNGKIQFLHTLKEGAANRSYGIHVAELAGLPAAVTFRAKNLLKSFEAQGGGLAGEQLSLAAAPSGQPTADRPAFLDEMAKLNLSHMTPLEALNKLYEWQREVSS